MAVGATLGTDAGALVGLFSIAVGATLGTDDWAGEEETGDGEGDGIVVGSCGGVGVLSGRAMCWRKMLLSWRSWRCWLSEMGDRGEAGGGDNNARASS
jgi:hypothetical protein